jgi:NADH-quinone oxidoreductase subunit M
MLTLLLILFPFLTAILLFTFSDKIAKAIAIGSAVIELMLACFTLFVLQNGDQSLLNMKCDWITSLGISFSLSIDGISMLMVLIAALVMPLVIFSSFNKTYANTRQLYALMMVMQSAMIGVFCATDGFLFYLFWEIALIPIYFICLVWGGENRQKITFKFFIYTLLGSLFMLLALIYVYLHTPERSFDIQALYAAGRTLSIPEQGWVMGAFFLAFAVKMPIFPFHTWQPNTYFTAPTAGVILLSGVMSKMATYGLIRWVLPMVPQGIFHYGHIAIILSVISIIYASCISIIQKDYKYLIAYASIAHLGLISAGILAANAQSLQGALMEMLSHAINTVGLFVVYDIIVTRTGTSVMNKLGGIRSIDSSFAFMFFIIVLSVVALPFTTGFVGEFLLILGLFQNSPILASVAGLSIILGVVYMFRSFQTMMLGETTPATLALPKLSIQEKSTLYIIVILIIGFGVYPKPILAITENTIKTLLEGIQ